MTKARGQRGRGVDWSIGPCHSKTPAEGGYRSRRERSRALPREATYYRHNKPPRKPRCWCWLLVKLHSDHFMRQDLLPCSIVVTTRWAAWRDPLKHDVPWLVSLYVTRKTSQHAGVGDFKAFWISAELGFMQYNLGSDITIQCVNTFIAHLQMLRPPLWIQILLSKSTAVAYDKVLYDVHHQHCPNLAIL